MLEPWIAEWQGFTGPRMRREIMTSEDAVRLFADLDAGGPGPVLIDFYREDGGGRSLTIAAGGQQSVLNYQASLDPPYYSSRGDVDLDEPTETFSYGGHESEFRARNLIPKPLALTVLAQFMRTGERPTVVPWEHL